MADVVLLVVSDAECAGAKALAARLSANVVVHEAGAVKGISEVRRAVAGIAEAVLRHAADTIVVASSAAGTPSMLAGELMACGPCPVVVVPADRAGPAVQAA